MSLIIEDGSAKTDSNSYATVSDLRAYAAARMASVPTADSDCEPLLIKAMDYLEGLNYKGAKTKPSDQSLLWPRSNVEVEGWYLRLDEIPRHLIQAQCVLAIEAQTVELLPTQDVPAGGLPIISETAGPVSTAYSNTGTVRRTPAVSKADALLKDLVRYRGLIGVRV